MTYTPTAVSPHQPRNWTALYEQQLAGRLSRAHEFVQINEESPEEIQPHFHSLLVLLTRGQERPFLHEATLKIIMALHPWPIRWGWIDEWLHVLEFAKEMAANLAYPRNHVDISLYLTEILLMVGQFEKALAIGQEAITLARKHAYAQPIAKAGWLLCAILTALGRSSETDEVLALVVDTPLTIPVDEREETAVWQAIMQAQSCRHRGQHQASYDHLYPVVVRLEADTDLAVDYKAEAYAVFAILLWNMNQYERAAHYMSQAMDVYEQVGDHVRIETLRGDLSLIYVAMGRFKQAEVMMQTAITQTEKRHLYYQLAQHIGTLAGFYMTQGRLVEAQPYLQKQIQLTEQTGNLHEQVRAVINRGCVRLLLGEYKDGLTDVEVGLPYYEAQNDQNMLILCQMSACYAYWGLGEDGKGKELAEEILVAATTRFIGMPHFALFARRLLSLFCQPEEALVLLQESLALARTYQSKIQEAACLLSMAGLITDSELQNSYWTQGCTILAHLDATSWIKNHTAQNPPFIGMLY